MTQLMPLTETDCLHFNITAEGVALDGTLLLPPEPQGVAIFAHPSGTSRMSPANRLLARRLNDAGLAALLFDMLTVDEDFHAPPARRQGRELDLLTRRLLAATEQIWLWPETSGLPLGYFGVGAGAAAALLACAEQPGRIGAIVSRCGMPDLAAGMLSSVGAPTLLIVGAADPEGITRNQAALPFLSDESSLALVHGACRQVETPRALEDMAQLTINWYGRFLG